MIDHAYRQLLSQRASGALNAVAGLQIVLARIAGGVEREDAVTPELLEQTLARVNELAATLKLAGMVATGNRRRKGIYGKADIETRHALSQDQLGHGDH